MRRVLALPLLVGLLLASVACSGGDTKSTGTGDRTRETCEDLLGAAGEKWVKSSSAQETGLVDVKDLRAAKSVFYDDARSWDPSSKALTSYAPSELCRIVVRDQKRHTSRLSISYGASGFPFDSPFGEKSDVYDEETLIRVNSDVKLVVRKDDGDYDYSVYVRCQVPGASAEQETGVPLAGSMTDTLTRDTGTEPHLRYLLHSARVVAKEFGCRNHPVVPATPPAD
ncbi:hypothetical protein OIB37_11940 [Streptomyces sp. NBC_00820]|uniref:hypothetical protein n=1 Tax=Streptomyces sp. NBC_00820 TaxID=2975842 RepID=UPI002ED5CEA6|nr:hypothetical protein OIB37_11940 [Streptomyces sp. NBC_00820]